MTPAQIANLRCITDVTEISGLPCLDDDAVNYAGSATWDDWRNHVPQILIHQWRALSEEARLCVYLTAKQVTVYGDGSYHPTNSQ